MNYFKHFPDNITIVDLTRGQCAVVDTELWPFLSQYQWCAAKSDRVWYAIATVHSVDTSMHRLLMPGVALVDHRNGDGLDNRIANLRSATKSQNAFNCRKRGDTSSVHGVYRVRSTGLWGARIRAEGKRIWLGSFKLEADAAKARQDAERLYYPDFPREVQL